MVTIKKILKQNKARSLLGLKSNIALKFSTHDTSSARLTFLSVYKYIDYLKCGIETTMAKLSIDFKNNNE